MADNVKRALDLNLQLERQRKFVAEDTINSFSTYVKQNPAAFNDADAAHPGCLCAGPRAADYQAHSLARIIRIDSYVEHHAGVPYGSRAKNTVRESLQTQPEKLQYSHYGDMRGEREHIWLADSQSLDHRIENIVEAKQANDGEKELAQLAQVALGLVHLTPGAELVRLDFPGDYFGFIATPTAIDGYNNPAFCVWRGEDRCGYTWDLERQSKGVPEFVTAPAELTERAQPVHLGWLSNAVWIDYERLLNRFQHE